MKKLIFYIPALILFAVSCEKEENSPSQNENEPVSEVKMITEVVSGGRGDATKATIGSTTPTFAWTAGDNVAVHVSNGKYVYTSDEGASGATLEASPAKASFTVVYPDGYSRDAFALYPSTIVDKDATNYGQSGQSLDVTLPSSYKLAQVQGEVSPCPMISTNTPGNGWNFYQLCGLLRLTINGIPNTAKRLEISFDGKNVAGNFAISDPEGDGTSSIALADASGSNSSVITITKDGTDAVLGATSLTVNIPLPVGEYTNVTIKAFDVLVDGSAILTITRPFNCDFANPVAYMRTATFPSAKTAFRGYEVSTGILKRDASTTPATYSLTSGEMVLTADPNGKNEHYALPAGCNPFEPAVYYKQAALNTYFHKWLTLRSELGATGNNINATSDELPAGWRFPTGGNKTSTDWGKIIFGTPKSTITVNGAAVTSKAYAMVSVTLDAGNSYGINAGTYYGMLLLRDGTTIPDGYITKIGSANYNTDNSLTEAQLNDLIKLGCLFIPASGYYTETFKSWRDLTSSWQYGQYWSGNYKSSTSFYYLSFWNTTNDPGVSSANNAGDKCYQVVKLVKPL